MRYISARAVKNKVVLLRVDFNFDLEKKEKLIEQERLKAALPTIEKIINCDAQAVILISHNGRPAGRKIKKLSLRTLAPILEKLLKKKVNFLTDLPQRTDLIKVPKGQIFLLENIRFWPEEEKNDKKFARRLAQMGDIFVLDAFSVAHRAQASVSAITQFLPAYGGLLLKKEIANLTRARDQFQRPLVLILGGAKISDKLPLLKNFSDKANLILLGGGPANTITASLDWPMGQSLLEKNLSRGEENSYLFSEKIILPVDFLTAENRKAKKAKEKYFWTLNEKEMALDIGPFAIRIFAEIIKQAKTIIWNGPMGYAENKTFQIGTKKIAQAILENKKTFSVVGGGDTIEALSQLKLLKKFKFISLGGGAMLEFLAGKKLPGLMALEEAEKE